MKKWEKMNQRALTTKTNEQKRKGTNQACKKHKQKQEIGFGSKKLFFVEKEGRKWANLIILVEI